LNNSIRKRCRGGLFVVLDKSNLFILWVKLIIVVLSFNATSRCFPALNFPKQTFADCQCICDISLVIGVDSGIFIGH
jgi:hypothetical protein